MDQKSRCFRKCSKAAKREENASFERGQPSVLSASVSLKVRPRAKSVSLLVFSIRQQNSSGRLKRTFYAQSATERIHQQRAKTRACIRLASTDIDSDTQSKSQNADQQTFEAEPRFSSRAMRASWFSQLRSCARPSAASSSCSRRKYAKLPNVATRASSARSRTAPAALL